MGRFLLKGGCVLTLGARTPNHPQADVLIDDGRIAEIGPGLRARDAQTVDASDTIVMPGFVDAHRHAWKTLLRGATTAGGRPPSAADYGPLHEPDDVYAATLLSLLSAVEAGITTVVDWSDGPAEDRCVEAALQAHADAGVRTVFVHASPPWAPTSAAPSPLQRLAAAGTVTGTATTFAFGSPEVDAANLDHLAADWGRARELGARIHVHARSGGVATQLAGRGLLGGDVTLVHCTTPTSGDLDAVAAGGAAVALTPANEMATGLGPAPLQQLIDKGIRPGLGVDDELGAPGDLFAQMRAVQSLQHATLFDLKLAGKAGIPNLLSTRDVIRYATVDGARVAGLAEVTGSLEVGKQADVLLLRTDRPNITPVNDPIGAVVWGMDASNVDWVFVAGKPVVRAGVLEADTSHVRDLAEAASRRLAAAGQLTQTTGGGSR